MSELERIHRALAVVKNAAESCQAQWVIGGSASLMLRGLPLSSDPRDLDIYCDEEDIHALYKALEPFAVDQPTLSVTDMYRSTLCHFIIHEIPVELVGGFEVKAIGCHYKTMVKALLIPFSEPIELHDANHSVLLVPLAHELWFNFLRGRLDRVDLIVRAYAEEPALHEGALTAIEDHNSFAIEAKRSLHQWLGKRKSGDM